MKKKRKILICTTIALVTVFVVGLSVIITNKLSPVTVIYKGKIDHSLRLKYFNDKHDVQLPMAKKLGIKPVANLVAFDKIKGDLTKISNLRGCFVEAKRPYLTPDAAVLLAKIGNDFADSLQARYIADHRIIVTSMFRTEEDVERLMKINKNTVKNSAHLYGTTFDIGWRRYQRYNRFSKRTNSQQLYDVLANVLIALKVQNCCYITQEQSQACFHITVRKNCSN
jgi:hypothetical protein